MTRRWQSKKGWFFLSVGRGKDDIYLWLLALGRFSVGMEHK